MVVDQRKATLKQLECALVKLTRAFDEPRTNPLWLDGTLHRVAVGARLTWNALRLQLAHEGIVTDSPLRAIARAAEFGWIRDETKWHVLLHFERSIPIAYEDSIARRICEHGRAALPEMRRLAELLAARARAA